MIICTGNAGFMGSHLSDLLNVKGLGGEVVGIDSLSGGFKRNIRTRSFIELDLASEATPAIIKSLRPEYIFHLAADATEGRSQFTPVSATRNNYMAYMNLLSGAIAGGNLKKVLLFSSMSVYGKQKPPFDETYPRMPEDVYAVAKASMERTTEILAEVHGFKYTIIRPHNVFGDRQNIRDPYRNVIGIFMNRIMQGKPPIIYGDGKQTRAFTYIDNFTRYALAAMDLDTTDSEIINIGPTDVYSVGDVAEMVLKAMDSTLRPIHYPARPLEVKHAHCTSDKATRLLDYKTTVDLETGIERMAGWAKELGPQPFKYLDSLEIVNDKTPTTWSKEEM